MKIPQLYLGIATLLLIAGWTPPATPRAFVGTTKDSDWPYRYKLTRAGERWSGTIEYHDTNGWVFWDTMDIVQQDKRQIRFKARPGSTSFRCGWRLDLENITEHGFSGGLTSDVQPGNRIVGLSFTTAVTEPGGAANRGQPVGSETNRTSGAAGPGG